MIFKAAITVVPKDDTKSVSKKDILKQLNQLNVDNLTDIIVGKHISLKIKANSKNVASAVIEEISELLIDEQIEKVSFHIEQI